MIYLDHNASSPLLPEVLEAMRPWLGRPGNPASVHAAGQAASAAVEDARRRIAAALGREARGIVFTSGATEANHLWFHGLGAVLAPGSRVAIGATEHPCVRAAAARAQAARLAVETLPVDADGLARWSSLAGVAAVSLMAANHETGVVQPVGALLGAVDPSCRVHVDATQALGRVPLALSGAHALTLSGHKLGGPGGVGALSLPDGGPWGPLQGGGQQERGRRAGTVPVASVVGLAAAVELALAELPARRARWLPLRARIEAAVRQGGGRVVGEGSERLPNTVCAVYDGLRGDLLVLALDRAGVCVSSGAACASGSQEPSPVLLAQGDPWPLGGLRVSLGPRSTAEDVDRLLEALPEVVERARLAAALEAS